MYWVIGLFDQKTEQKVEEIWTQLSENSIAFYSQEMQDARPHITLASYYDLDEDEYIRLMDDFYADKLSLNITFNTIGSFMNYKTIFLSPIMTKELMNFHSDHYEYFKKYHVQANTNYLPDQWIPHCTLANKISTNKLSEAFHYCLNNHQTIEGKIIEIALVKLASDANPIMHAPIIYSKKLSLSV